MTDRHKAPEISLPEKIILPDPDVTILPNNVPLYIINTGTQDVARIEFIFNAGSAYHRHPLMASFTNELIDEGTSSKTSYEIASLFDFYGAYVQTECTADYASVTLFTLNKFLKETVQLLVEILSEANYPEDEALTYIRQEKQRLVTNLEKVDFLARKHFNAALYKNHIYGYFPSSADFDSLNVQDARAFHKTNYTEAVKGILAAGKFSSDERKMLTDLLIIPSVGAGNPLKHKAPEPYRNVEKHVEKKGAVQNAIRIGKRLFNRRHPEYASMTIVNTILGGYFGSRLMANIREDKGFTYGIGSALVSLADDGYFFIATEVGSEVCAAALKEIYHEVAQLQEMLVPEEELALVKNYLTGSFQRSIDGPFALAERFKTVLLSGLNNDYYRSYLDVVKTITPEAVLQLARKHLSVSEMTQITVGQN